MDNYPGRIRSLRQTLVLALAGFLAFAGLLAAIPVPPASAQGGIEITINNYAFTPNTVTVVIGINNTVTWNMEQAGVPYHTVTPNPGDPVEDWGSGELKTGQSYTFTFTVAGTYNYHCSLHTFMTGTVVVLAATSSTTSTAAATSSSSFSSASSQSTTGAVPEFPFAAAGVAAFVVLLLTAYFLVRKRQVPSMRSGTGPA